MANDNDPSPGAFTLSRKAPIISNKPPAATREKKAKRKPPASSNSTTPTLNHHHLAKKRKKTKIPIPSFLSDLERLEREFFSSSDDDDAENNNGKKKKKGTNKAKTSTTSLTQESPSPSNNKKDESAAGSILDSDSSDDDLLNFDIGITNKNKKNTTTAVAVAVNSAVANNNGNGNNLLLGRNDDTSPLESSATCTEFKSSSLVETSSTTKDNAAATAQAHADDNNNNNTDNTIQTAVLLQAVHDVFAKSDVYTITVKQVMAELQTKFGKHVFDKETKRLIRQELTQLVRNKTNNTTSTTGGTTKTTTTTTTTITANESVDACKSALVAAEKCNGVLPEKPPRQDTASFPTEPRKLSMTRAGINNSGDSTNNPSTASRAPRKRAAKSSTSTTRTTSTTMNDNSRTTNPHPTVEAAVPPQPQQRGRKPKSPGATSAATTKPRKPTTRTTTTVAAAAATAAAKPSRKRKATCRLCSNCPCSLTGGTLDAAATTKLNLSFALSQSDAAIEKALMQRLQKLEMITEGYEDQTDTVRRRLKKHRRDMWNKYEESQLKNNNHHTNNKASSRFLPDVEDFDRQWEEEKDQLLARKRLDANRSSKAKATMFATSSWSSLHASAGGGGGGGNQVTLTQMLGTRTTTTNDETSTASASGAAKDETLLPTIAEEDETELADGDNLVVDDGKGGGDADGILLNRGDGEAVGGGSCSSSQSEEEPESDDSEDDAPLDNVLRIEVRNGVEQGDQPARIWGSCHASFSCPWDLLIHPSQAMEAFTFDPNLLIDQQMQQSSPEKPEAVDDLVAVALDMPMLSQRSKLLADELIAGIVKDSAKLAAIESAAPNWRENIMFSLHQQETGDLSSALKCVKDAQTKLQQTKSAILKAAEQQEMALSVFESALNQSLSRFDEDDRQGVSPSQSTQSSPPSLLLEAEAKTLSPLTSRTKTVNADSSEKSNLLQMSSNSVLTKAFTTMHCPRIDGAAGEGPLSPCKKEASPPRSPSKTSVGSPVVLAMG